MIGDAMFGKKILPTERGSAPGKWRARGRIAHRAFQSASSLAIGRMGPPLTGATVLLGALFMAERPLARATSPEAERSSLHEVIREAQRKVVKVYGAGGLKQLEAYQSGVLISGDGQIVTALSYVLDTDDLVVVLDDGRKFQAEFLGSDPVLEIALLKIPVSVAPGESSSSDDLASSARSRPDARPPGDAATLRDRGLRADRAHFDLAYFDLNRSVVATLGERVLALSNLYGIAAGDEPVSVLQGVVTAIAPLDAGRGSFRADFSGVVYVVDAYANNPGAAGGALVDWEGRLLGILGKELKGRVTGAWLNYALPIDACAKSVEAIRNGQSQLADASHQPAPVEPLTLVDLGLTLVPNILARTPPYVDAVTADSPAGRAGVRPDDLLAFVASQPVASCDETLAAVARRERQEALTLGLLRDGKLLEVEIAIDDSGDQEAKP